MLRLSKMGPLREDQSNHRRRDAGSPGTTKPPPLWIPGLRMLVESRLHSCVMLVSAQADDFNVICDVVVFVFGVARDDASRAHPAAK